MKTDKEIGQEILLDADAVRELAEVSGEREVLQVDGRELLAVRTNAVVRLKPPRADLAPFNVLVLNLYVPEPFACSLVTRFDHSTRSPGMTQNDSRVSVLHFNQPDEWKGWQRVLIPAENLVPTGFPDDWRDVETISLDFHSGSDEGRVVVGDVELVQVQKPKGPRMTDRELLEALDLGLPRLSSVARMAEKGDVQGALAAYAACIRKAKLPPLPEPRQHGHYSRSDADAICRHHIMEQQLPRKIDWHCNPVGYLEWNHAFNRHTWMGTLARAFHEANRKKALKYARELNSLMRSWMAQNPEPVGHNGGLDPAWETLSTSCRINWSWPHVLGVAQKSEAITDRTLIDVAKMWHAHAEHLLKYWGHCNWYISESTAILTTAAHFPEFRRAEHWRTVARQRLENEMVAQVFPDGVQFELSPGYHTMCANLFYLAKRRLEFAGGSFSEEYGDKLAGMFDYLAAITRPDGTYPVMNDAGTCLPRGNARLLEAGRTAKRQDWIWAGSGGSEGKPPAVGSVHFPDAGYAVMRSGWDEDDLWAFIDMGHLGAAHKHEDKLQVEFYANRTAFLVDPGISSYQNDPVVRFFRRSEAHNTISVDGLGQWRGGAPRAQHSASSRGQNLWVCGEGLDAARGVYDAPYGYSHASIHARGKREDQDRVLEGITHTRMLVFVRPDYWLVLDSVEGKGTHDVEALWHFTPMHVRIDAESSTVRTNRLTHANMELICRGDWQQGELELITGREVPVQGFIAIDREVKPAPCAVVRRRKRLPLHGATVAVPYATGSESHFRVKARTVTGKSGKGMLITVDRPGAIRDRFLWRHTGKGRLEGGGISANGLLGAVRTDADDRVVYAGLVDGSSLKAGQVSLKGRKGELAETDGR